MDLNTLKVGDPIYWHSKGPSRTKSWPVHQGKYQGMLQGKVLIYVDKVLHTRGMKATGKTFKVNPDQIVHAPE